jgi:hypothetical protein
MTVELQYLTRKKATPGILNISHNVKERVLQYRQNQDDGRPLPEWAEYTWTEWADIPEVEE